MSTTLDFQTVPAPVDELHLWGEAQLARARELLSEQGERRIHVATAELDDAILVGDGDA